jgi:hypothetical protein
VALRIAAVSGVLMLALMWFAEVPFAQFTSAGEPTGSPNPFADFHDIYAIVLVVLAATCAGTTWGLGRNWARLPFVHRTAGPCNTQPNSTSRPRPTRSRPAPRSRCCRGHRVARSLTLEDPALSTSTRTGHGVAAPSPRSPAALTSTGRRR